MGRAAAKCPHGHPMTPTQKLERGSIVKTFLGAMAICTLWLLFAQWMARGLGPALGFLGLFPWVLIFWTACPLAFAVGALARGVRWSMQPRPLKLLSGPPFAAGLGLLLTLGVFVPLWYSRYLEPVPLTDVAYEEKYRAEYVSTEGLVSTTWTNKEGSFYELQRPSDAYPKVIVGPVQGNDLPKVGQKLWVFGYVMLDSTGRPGIWEVWRIADPGA